MDAIVQLASGQWGAFEVKLGGEKKIAEGAEHLIALSKKVDTKVSHAPSFLAVLTGGQYAYTRPDGVHVIPLGCLCH